jgi:hypothetical protein
VVGNIYSFEINGSSVEPRWKYLYCNVSIASSFSPVFQSPLSLKVNDIVHINADEIASKHSSLMRPDSITAKDEMMHRPFHVSGKVWRLHHSTTTKRSIWVELLGKKQNSSKGDVIFIYVTPKCGMDMCTGVNPGDTILFRRVYPVYLWGRLQGFAMTIRSSSVIQERTTSISGGVRLCKIPCVDRASGVFSIWCAYMQRRLAQCFSSTPGLDTITTNCCRFIVDKFSAASMAAFESPVVSDLEELCDADVGPLFAIRGGHDIDWLCSQLPEVSFISCWICWNLHISYQL